MDGPRRSSRLAGAIVDGAGAQPPSKRAKHRSTTRAQQRRGTTVAPSPPVAVRHPETPTKMGAFASLGMDLFKEVVFAADAATVAVLMTTSKSMQQAISGLHMWAYYVSRLETHFPMANMLKEILEIGEATPDLTCPVYPHQPAKDTEWFKKHDPRFVDAQGWEALEPWKKFGRLYTFASQMIRNFMAFLDDQLYNRGMFMPLLGEDPEAFRWCWFEGSDEAEFGKFRSHLDRMAVMEQSSPKRFQLCMSLISIMQAIDDHRSGDIFHFSEAFAGVAFDPDTGSSYGERFFPVLPARLLRLAGIRHRRVVRSPVSPSLTQRAPSRWLAVHQRLLGRSSVPRLFPGRECAPSPTPSPQSNAPKPSIKHV